MVAIN